MKNKLEACVAKERNFEVECGKLASSLEIKTEELGRITSEKNKVMSCAISKPGLD